MLWVHKTCNVITKWLVENPSYICPRCKAESRLTAGQTVTEVDVDGTMLDVDTTFCYLGDMLCSGGGCDSDIAARCCVSRGKFRKLLPVLTTRHLSPGYVPRCARPSLARLCSMVVRRGNQRNPNLGGSAQMTVPWSVGFVASRDRD